MNSSLPSRQRPYSLSKGTWGAIRRSVCKDCGNTIVLHQAPTLSNTMTRPCTVRILNDSRGQIGAGVDFFASESMRGAVGCSCDATPRIDKSRDLIPQLLLWPRPPCSKITGGQPLYVANQMRAPSRATRSRSSVAGRGATLCASNVLRLSSFASLSAAVRYHSRRLPKVPELRVERPLECRSCRAA